jgi:hypothetical protein
MAGLKWRTSIFSNGGRAKLPFHLVVSGFAADLAGGFGARLGRVAIMLPLIPEFLRM